MSVIFWALVLLLWVMSRRRARAVRGAARRVPVTRGHQQRFATREQRAALFRRQRGLCNRCRRPLAWFRTPPECDHVVPWSRGGPTTLANLQLLCRPCHRAKTRAEARRYGWRIAA